MSLFDRIVREVRTERQRQDEKWGVQNHPMTLESSLHDAEHWQQVAAFWKKNNDFRVNQGNALGLTRDRNCAWDGILIEELAETFAEERPGLQYAEAVQTAGVAFAILDFLNRRSKETTGHFAGCPALDVDGLVHAPEACDCDKDAQPGRYEARVWDNTRHAMTTWGVWDTWQRCWKLDGDLTKATADREADRMNA